MNVDNGSLRIIRRLLYAYVPETVGPGKGVWSVFGQADMESDIT
jgi:hypothetical protein